MNNLINNDNNVGSISKEADKCEKCSKRNICNEKRMELCAYIIPKGNIAEKLSSSIDESMAQHLMRDTMLVNDGTGNMTQVYKDEIEKQLYSKLYEKLDFCSLGYGA